MYFYTNCNLNILTLLVIEVSLSVTGELCLNDIHNISNLCGYCGLCRHQLSSRTNGFSDEYYLTKVSQLHNNLKYTCCLCDHCRMNPNICQDDGIRFTGKCISLYDTYQCQCYPKYFGQNCEYEVDYQYEAKFNTTNNISQHAFIDNIVYTPMFYSENHATVLISILRKGTNLEVHLDNGRGEQLIYNYEKCEKHIFKTVKTIQQFCKNLFFEPESIRICLGIIYNNSEIFIKDGCLIALQLSYPININHESGQMIYKRIGVDSLNLPVLGKVERVSATVFNRFSSITILPVFKHTFSMINVYNELDHHNHSCYTKVELLNCGKNMHNIPKFTRYRDAVIISSIRLNPITSFKSDTFCKSCEKVNIAWQIFHLEKNHDELSDIPLKVFFNKNVYFIEQGSLYYGLYKVKLKATAVFRQDLVSGCAYCYFEIVRIPIQSIILGGSTRHLNYKQNISFEILSLLVPDRYEPSKTIQALYKWQCDDEKKHFCSSFETSNPVRVIPGPFEPLKVFNFTLNVITTDNHQVKIEQHPENQVVIISNETASDIAIKCLFNCGGSVFRSNPQEIIHLEVSTVGFGALSDLEYDKILYNWKYSLKELEDLKETDAIRVDGTGQNVLIVKKDMLLENQKYKFVVFGGSQNPGHAELEIQTCSFPQNVTCHITPESGYKGETFFNISCSCNEHYEYFTSTMYEFYDRFVDDEHIGRLLGFSATGMLERVLLTRSKLYVRTINIYGAFFETVINVSLSPPTKSFTLSHTQFEEYDLNDYIYQMGLVSAYGDRIAAQPHLFNLTNILLKKLKENDINDITGALLLNNVIYNVACNESSDKTKHLQSESILTIARLLYHATEILKTTTIDPYKTTRYITTTRAMDIARSVLNCSSVVLGIKDNNNSLNTEGHSDLKRSTLYTMLTLDNIITVLTFELLPSVKRILLKSSNMMILVLDTTLLNNEIVPTVKMSYSLTKILRSTPGYNVEIIKFMTNPFWWSNGETINSDVIDLKLSYGANHILKLETKNQFHFGLTVKNFQPVIVSGSVKQPNPKNSPDVNDFVVAVHRIAAKKNAVIFIKFIIMEYNSVLRVVALQDKRPDYDFMTSKPGIVTNNSEQLRLSNRKINEDSFFYVGILPGEGEKIGENFNYSFKLYGASCKVWRYESWMSGKKCKVNKRTKTNNLVCSCSMLTLTIGGEMYIPQNEFNPFSDIPLLMTVSDSPIIVVFLCIMLLIFIALYIWSVRKHEEDRREMNVIVLADNDPRDSFAYLLAVFTGSRFLAGTSSNVGVRLFGEEGVSRTHILCSTKRRTLKANSDDWFLLFTHHHLGPLTNISLWIDYSGKRPNWYCSKVFVCDINQYETDTFFVEKWLGITAQDIRLKVMKECATCNETNKTSRIFFENIWFSFRELHLWASIFFRHPRSIVTRPERLAIAFCSLLITMMITTLLYAASTPQLEDFAEYSITKNVVLIGVTSSLFGSLFCFIVLPYIKSSYSFIPCPPNFHEHSDNADMYHFKRKLTKTEDPTWLKILWKNIKKYIKTRSVIPVQSSENVLVGVKINKRKIGCCWITCLILIVISVHVIIMFSFQLGKLKTLLWLTSLLISIVQVIFITSPMKIIINAFLLGITKTRYYQLMTHNIEMGRIIENLKLKMSDGFEGKLAQNRTLHIYKPPGILDTLRLQKDHNVIVTIWAAAYIFGCSVFLTITVCLIGGFDLDQYFLASARICNDIQSLEFCEFFHHTQLKSIKEVLEDIHENILPVLYSREWYNSKDVTSPQESFHNTGWLKNGMTRLIGYPRLRQIRIKNLDSCSIPNALSNLSSECTPPLTETTEDRGNYSTGWTHEDWMDNLFDQSPWVFRKPAEDIGTNVNAPSGYDCHGGGYIASLHRTLHEGKTIIKDLIDTHWIDKKTRIVIFEFTTYNVNRDIFTAVIFVTETNPIGSVTTGFTIESMQLSEIGISGVFLVIFLLIFTIRVLGLMNVMGVESYFKNFWNIQEVILLVSFITVTVYYVQHVIEVSQYREKLQKQGKDNFFQMEILTSNFFTVRNSIGILFSLGAFRLLRIIRFNSDVRNYINDLVAARYEMYWTWIVVVLFLFIHWRFIMYLLVTPPAYSMTEVLVFRSNFQKVIYQYKDATGRLLAFFLSLISQIGKYSFVISLNHYYKKGQIRRGTSFSGQNTKSRLWESTFD